MKKYTHTHTPSLIPQLPSPILQSHKSLINISFSWGVPFGYWLTLLHIIQTWHMPQSRAYVIKSRSLWVRVTVAQKLQSGKG